MTAFAEDFRSEIEGAYNDLINLPKGDRLRVAQLAGVGGMAQWMRDDPFPELNRALECGEPPTIEFACARIGLAALMMRDASRALGKMFDDAYAGPEEGREERILAGIKQHARQMTGSQMIAHERFRQVDDEKWTAANDDDATESQLARAGLAYAVAVVNGPSEAPNAWWPWAANFWKPTSSLRMLVKAGALIAAEIDRRLRAGEKL